MMAKRFPTRAEDAEIREQVKADLHIMHNGPPPFAFDDENGQLLGCYASMPYTPHITPHAFSLMKSIYSPATLPARTRQMGILAVAAVYKSDYVLYCHERVSAHLGFTPAQFRAAAVQGLVPDDVSEAERVAYETAYRLAADRNPLDERTWNRAREVLGREGVAGLAHVVAGYQYVCLLLSVAGPEPGGWKPAKDAADNGEPAMD